MWDYEVAEQFTGGRVDDADFDLAEVVDEQEPAGSGVGSTDADVVQSAVDAQGELPVVVDAVSPYPIVALAGLGDRGGVPASRGVAVGAKRSSCCSWSAILVGG